MGQGVECFGGPAGPLRAGTTGPPPPKLPGEVLWVGQGAECFGWGSAGWCDAPGRSGIEVHLPQGFLGEVRA